MTARERQVLTGLRRTALALPEARETETFGHPTFQAGTRTFAVLETYHGDLSLAFKSEPRAAHELLDDPRFYVTPYSGKHGWLSLRVGTGKLDWKEIAALVTASYRLVALRRMLAALDGATKPRSAIVPRRARAARPALRPARSTRPARAKRPARKPASPRPRRTR